MQEEVYNKFSSFCKDMGISMSKQVDRFMESFISEEPVAKKEYLEKLEQIRKGKFIRYSSMDEFKESIGLS